MRLQHVAKTPVQLVGGALQRYHSFIFERAERLGLLNLGLNAFNHPANIFVITTNVKRNNVLRLLASFETGRQRR